MQKFTLRGLPEGIAGQSFVLAFSVEEVFEIFPVLKSIRDKIDVRDQVISGFAACDG